MSLVANDRSAVELVLRRWNLILNLDRALVCADISDQNSDLVSLYCSLD